MSWIASTLSTPVEMAGGDGYGACVDVELVGLNIHVELTYSVCSSTPGVWRGGFRLAIVEDHPLGEGRR